MFIDDLQLPNKVHDEGHKGRNGRLAPRPRRLSTYEDGDAVMDPEGETRSSTSRRDR